MNLNKMFDWLCKLCLIFFVLICLNSLIGDIFFRIKYSFPKISEKTNNSINIISNPIQKEITNKKLIKIQGEKNMFDIEPQAEYSISGLVVAKNSNFWFRDIMRNKFDDICLIDLGIVWGDLANSNNLYKYLKFKSKKTLGESRTLFVNPKVSEEDMIWDYSYIDSHISHTHFIPANINVMSALLKIKKNDIVKIDGYLVDIYLDNGEIISKTSLSRYDKNTTSRGFGACEVMLAKQVQIKDKIYR